MWLPRPLASGSQDLGVAHVPETRWPIRCAPTSTRDMEATPPLSRLHLGEPAATRSPPNMTSYQPERAHDSTPDRRRSLRPPRCSTQCRAGCPLPRRGCQLDCVQKNLGARVLPRMVRTRSRIPFPSCFSGTATRATGTSEATVATASGRSLDGAWTIGITPRQLSGAPS